MASIMSATTAAMGRKACRLTEAFFIGNCQLPIADFPSESNRRAEDLAKPELFLEMLEKISVTLHDGRKCVLQGALLATAAGLEPRHSIPPKALFLFLMWLNGA